MNREQLLNRKPRLGEVHIDDDILHLRAWSGTVRASFIDANEEKGSDRTLGQQNEYLNALVVVLSACDEEGNLIFSHDDIPQVQEVLDAGTIQKIVTAAFEMNGLNAGAIDEAEKKSEATPSNDSTST